jgi:hypothetical protein
MNNVPFHATTRGHGTNLQYGKIRNALNINLGNFRSVEVDADNNRLTIGGATPFGDVFPSVWGAGKEIRGCARSPFNFFTTADRDLDQQPATPSASAWSVPPSAAALAA